MENFRLGRYLLLIAITQLLVILLFGYIQEDGDINATSMYLVVYLLPALLFHFMHGFLIVFFHSQNSGKQLLLLLLIPIGLSLGLNEWIQPQAQELYRFTILATFVVNGLFFYSLQPKKL